MRKVVVNGVRPEWLDDDEVVKWTNKEGNGSSIRAGSLNWGLGSPQEVEFIEVREDHPHFQEINPMRKNYTEVPQPPIKKLKSVDVNLTVEELVTLQIILNNIGGHPDHSLRGYADQISKKVEASKAIDVGLRRSPSDVIYFADCSKHDPEFRRLVVNAD